MPETAFVAFGSNIGDGRKNINDAAKALSLVPGIKVEKLSRFFVTKPWGYEAQPDFINACAKLLVELSPEALLGACLGVEAGFGRVRTIKNGPRIIDIDLLLYENEVRNTKELILPHPRMTERRFVLEPLNDISENGFVLDFDVKSALMKLPEED